MVHQVFELWFKLVLHELSHTRDILGRQGPEGHRATVPEEMIPSATHAIARVNEIFRVATDHWRVMETMPTANFLEFRDMVIPASGFQSAQFRELEILAGLPEDDRMDFEGTPYEAKLAPADHERIESRKKEMSLKDALMDWLGRTPIDELFPGFPEAFLTAYARYADEQAAYQDANPNLAPSQKTAAHRQCERAKDEARRYLLGGDDAANRAHQSFVFIASYRREPLLRWPNALIDAVIEFEQNFRSFRFRHARLVERMIGARTGSGGSAGVAYLDATSRKYKIFGQLLEARSFLLSPDRLPPIPHPDRLAFRFS